MIAALPKPGRHALQSASEVAATILVVVVPVGGHIMVDMLMSGSSGGGGCLCPLWPTYALTPNGMIWCCRAQHPRAAAGPHANAPCAAAAPEGHWMQVLLPSIALNVPCRHGHRPLEGSPLS